MDGRNETHLKEILDLYDFSMGSEPLGHEDLKRLLQNNYENRCAHHHVFDAHLTVELLDYAGFKIENLHAMNNTIFASAKLVAEKPDNSQFLLPSHPVYQNVKFPSDFNKHQSFSN